MLLKIRFNNHCASES